MTLKLTNNTTKKEYIIEELQDNCKSNAFFSFNIVLPEGMNDGEYTYQLIDNNKRMATGLVQIGDYTRETVVHTNDKNGYIAYEG